MENLKTDFHESNRQRWNAAADGWAAMHDQRGTWKICHQDPALVFTAGELKHLGDLDGKKACVLGSGDNLATFALVGLGAQVTSVDISQAQLDVGADRAQQLGLQVNFVQADVCDLGGLPSDFDLVYTGGHVAVWVSDLQKYYQEAVRILKAGGIFMVNEYHPFRRVWKQGVDRLEIGYDYYDRGPFKFEYNENVLEPAKGGFDSFEFHWSVSDLINAILTAGCQVVYTEEFGSHVGDWEGAPMQGLPEYLLLVGRKRWSQYQSG